MDDKELGESYDKRRDEIIARIETGERSATLSGIEYYQKPWAEASPDDRAYYTKVTRAFEYRHANMVELVRQCAVKYQDTVLFEAAHEIERLRKLVS